MRVFPTIWADRSDRNNTETSSGSRIDPEDEADGELQRLAGKFFEKTIEHSYSYNFTWMGRPIIQYPQDMIAMQEIIWSVRPDLIIETGIAHGGSLIFYASMLELIGGPGTVLGIDIDIRAHNREAIEAHPMSKRIEMMQGSSIDPAVVQQVAEVAGRSTRVMVALDSNHTHDHVLGELEMYSPFVTQGSYLVVFDTVVDDLPKSLYPDRPGVPGTIRRPRCASSCRPATDSSSTQLSRTSRRRAWLRKATCAASSLEPLDEGQRVRSCSRRTGFVGRHVLKRLTGDGVPVRILVRDGHQLALDDVGSLVEVTITQDLFAESEERLTDALGGSDTIIHAAWYAEPGKYLDSPRNYDCLLGTIRLAKCFAAAGGRRFVGVGSCFEYDSSPGRLGIETPLAPRTAYAASKAATYSALSYVMPTMNVQFVWARLFYLYGEGEDSRWLGAVPEASVVQWGAGRTHERHPGPRFPGDTRSSSSARRGSDESTDGAGQYLLRIAGHGS